MFADPIYVALPFGLVVRGNGNPGQGQPSLPIVRHHLLTFTARDRALSDSGCDGAKLGEGSDRSFVQLRPGSPLLDYDHPGNGSQFTGSNARTPCLASKPRAITSAISNSSMRSISMPRLASMGAR